LKLGAHGRGQARQGAGTFQDASRILEAQRAGGSFWTAFGVNSGVSQTAD